MNTITRAYLEYLRRRTELMAEIYGPNDTITQEARLALIQASTVAQEQAKKEAA